MLAVKEANKWRAIEWLEHQPRMATASIILFLLLSVAFSVVSQSGFELRGDGAYYLAMQQAWLQGSPVIEQSVLESLAQRPDIAGDEPWYMLIEGPDGRRFCIHFWFYSLLSAPFAVLLSLFGLDPLFGFLALNAICVAAAGYWIARSPALSMAAKLLVAVSFGVTAVNWYAAWPHPEVFTASLLLIAAIGFLERRILLASLCVGAAALQNPSAILMLGALGIATLMESWDNATRRLRFNLIFDHGWRLFAGAVVAAIAPAFNLIFVGVANPIVSEGFVRFSQLNFPMFGHLLFDLDQGAIIGFPFVFLGLAAVVALRVSRARNEGRAVLFDRADVLLLGVALMSVPVLTQGNFNAGQYYVTRYVAWIFAPALVWLGLQFDRTPKIAAGAWGAGLAIYATAFVAFLGAKFLHGVESRRDPALPAYIHSLQFKPWTRFVIDYGAVLYNPWRGVFAERAIGRHEVHEPRPRELPIAYRRSDGVITKVLAATDEPFRCEGGRFEPIQAGGAIVLTSAGEGAVYLNGEVHCAIVASPPTPIEQQPRNNASLGFRDCNDCPELVAMPGQSFAVGRYEVTFAEWDACVAAGGCGRYSPSDAGWGRGERPVIHVSWRDAQAYVQWLSERTGQSYRLLTSAEWEMAARAGTPTHFSWGDQLPICHPSAANGANFNACLDNRTQPVGSFGPNAFGLHDMHGNVWEWVADCNASNCSERLIRGGSWSFGPNYLRSAFSTGDTAVYRLSDYGFRVARQL